MNLNTIAKKLGISLPVLVTGRKGKPALKLVKGEEVDKPKKPE